MMEPSPAIQALQKRNAEALLEAVKERVRPATEQEALEFSQWLSRRMYEDARAVAHAARKEQEAAQARESGGQPG